MVSVIQPSSLPEPGPLTREAALDAIALAAVLLFAHGQTTERTAVCAEPLGRTLGVPVTALPSWGQLTVEIDSTTLSQTVPARPLGVDMGKVLASANVATGAFVACILVSVIVTPVVDRLQLPFAAVGFSAVVSMMPGFFLFHAASGLVELVSIGPHAPAALLTSVAVNGTTAFLVILAMTLGLILPRMLFEHFLPAPRMRHGKDVLWIATSFNMTPASHDMKDRAGAAGVLEPENVSRDETGSENDPRTAMNFVLVNHRTPRWPSCCATCDRPLQRSYLHDLSTRSRYCSVECYPGRTAGSMVRSFAKADPFDLVILLMVLPKFTIDVASAVFDCTWRD
jgi:hypothetical protein